MNFQHIKEVIREGVITQKKTVEPEGMQHCTNCGAEFQGAYCPHCGQYWQVKRITIGSALKGFVSNVIGLQANLPRTLVDLFYRPGHLINDYLDGKRMHYSNPFSTILLLATMFLFLNQYVTRGDIRDASMAYSRDIGSGLSSVMGVSQEEMEKSSAYSQHATDVIYDNFGLFNLLLVPILTVPFWVAFRKEGRYRQRPMNLAEATTAMGFVGCQNMVVNMVSLPFTTPQTISLVTTLGWFVCIPVFLLALWQIAGTTFWRFVWRLVVFYVISVVLMFITFMTIITAVAALSIYGKMLLSQ